MDNRKHLDISKLRVELNKIAVDIKQNIPRQWSLRGKTGSVDIDEVLFTNGLFEIVETLINDKVDYRWFVVKASGSVSIELLAIWGVEALDFQFTSYDITDDSSDAYYAGINEHCTIRKSDICK